MNNKDLENLEFQLYLLYTNFPVSVSFDEGKDIRNTFSYQQFVCALRFRRLLYTMHDELWDFEKSVILRLIKFLRKKFAG